jgi:hypothetical protein
MIQSFQVIDQNQDAFISPITLPKKQVQELKGCYSGRNGKNSKYRGIIKRYQDFTEGQKKLMVLVAPCLSLWKMWHYEFR